MLAYMCPRTVVLTNKNQVLMINNTESKAKVHSGTFSKNSKIRLSTELVVSWRH